jgi:hypothetical protein
MKTQTTTQQAVNKDKDDFKYPEVIAHRIVFAILENDDYYATQLLEAFISCGNWNPQFHTRLNEIATGQLIESELPRLEPVIRKAIESSRENSELSLGMLPGDLYYTGDYRTDSLINSNFKPIAFNCIHNENKLHVFRRRNGLLEYLQAYEYSSGCNVSSRQGDVPGAHLVDTGWTPAHNSQGTDNHPYLQQLVNFVQFCFYCDFDVYSY